MPTRRDFLQAFGATLAAAPLLSADAPAIADDAKSAPAESSAPKRLAVVTTLWNYKSHAWHMAERFLAGYPHNGRWHRSPFHVVSAYVDQRPEADLSGQRAEEFGFKIYPTVAEALRCGGSKLDVDAVLLIGEHGNYPINEYGQKQYPRYELFQQIVEVFRKDGRTTPVFNDKHLSWKFEWAKEMVDTAREMKFPFLAGSSLPNTFRLPSVDLPLGAEVEEILCVAHGALDIYDFHALESLQCFAERRKGGETGVKWIYAQRGPAVWDAMKSGSWSKGGWDPQLFEACLSRSHTLKQAPTNSHRYPTEAQMAEWVKDPIAYRFEYVDGTRGTMLLLNGLTEDFLVAVRQKGQSEPLSTLLHLPPVPNVYYSAGLMGKADEMFVTGKAPYPVERTLLTSGMVEAALHSLKDGKRLETPLLAEVKYAAPKESQFLRN